MFGSGNKIIDQYPKNGININTKDRVFLFTNDENRLMPDLTGYSVKEAKVILDKLEIKYDVQITGYVNYQSIIPGTIVTDDMIVVLN